MTMIQINVGNIETMKSTTVDMVVCATVMMMVACVKISTTISTMILTKEWILLMLIVCQWCPSGLERYHFKMRQLFYTSHVSCNSDCIILQSYPHILDRQWNSHSVIVGCFSSIINVDLSLFINGYNKPISD